MSELIISSVFFLLGTSVAVLGIGVAVWAAITPNDVARAQFLHRWWWLKERLPRVRFRLLQRWSGVIVLSNADGVLLVRRDPFRHQSDNKPPMRYVKSTRYYPGIYACWACAVRTQKQDVRDDLRGYSRVWAVCLIRRRSLPSCGICGSAPHFYRGLFGESKAMEHVFLPDDMKKRIGDALAPHLPGIEARRAEAAALRRAKLEAEWEQERQLMSGYDPGLLHVEPEDDFDIPDVPL